jgi:hypothetical protein
LTSPDGPSVSRITGQLGYLFEERPEMARASAAELARWLSREDRMARAREQDPLGADDEVRAAADALEDRVTEAMVTDALKSIRPEQ